MRAWMLSMAIGIAVVAWLPQLPSLNRLPLLLIPALLCVAWRLFLRRRSSTFLRHGLPITLLALLLGFGWGCLYGHYVRAGLLPLELEQQSLVLSGKIVGLVERQSGFQQRPVLRFQFAVDTCTLALQRCPANLRRVQLNWYEAPTAPDGDEPHAGEYWQLRVLLKRPRGFANPGGFDYAAWLVANRIGATGHIERSSDNRNITAASPRAINSGSIDSWRDRAQHYLNQRLANAQYRGLLLGLLLGDGSAIPQSQWELFRATGTVHLFVVSGLQIALTGGLVFGLSRLWWRSPFAISHRRNYWFGIAPAWLAALLYALMAGFGLPLQRALIMFAILLFSCVARREYAASSSWILALWLTLLFDPLGVIDAGFWFSFIAVAAILLTVSGRREHRQWLSSWGRVQIAIFIASIPVLLMLSGQLTLLALPANLIAIPLSTFVTMPLAFIALICDAFSFDIGAYCWQWADTSLHWLMQLLTGLQHYGAGVIWHPRGIGVTSIVFAGIAVALLLLPRGMPGRWTAPIFLLPLLWPALNTVAPGDYRLTVIDVGQGLSVLVETAEHRLLYDTGPVFGPERSVADLTTVPLLRRAGVETLDTVIVSHKDNDHSGGLGSVVNAFAVQKLLVGDSLGAAREEFCRAGMQWQWDGVDFDILYPVNDEFSGNNHSCVLQVRAGGVVTLLPGDIERSGEYRLLDNPRLAQADILLAPHHGSSSSSSATFIAQLQPRYVVFSSGYRNRFHHPNPAVEQRYREQKAELFNTATDGALIFEITHGRVAQITRARSGRNHYWD